ncbi:alpha/beta hydrolase family protein [Pontibacter cellulosilyticus]|uniref:Alpha/beta hydrolase n=1 Tax=Pontibacter cellulosilyticus TaxID=1720253 RepID=A0A923NB15_9BACT|nr:alpha/beta fold hydrolase [Pontibacter cellulosilyticus]MBC5994919.1 alpha/beta hydrolase [Pontibacter cellulosilyticus]
MQSILNKQQLISAVVLVVALFIFPTQYLMSQGVKPVQGGFLLQNGSDTLTIERYTRKGNTLEGRVLVRNQVPFVYKAAIKNNKAIERISIEVLQRGAPEGAAPQQEAILVFKGDSIYSISKKGQNTERDTIKTSTGAMTYHPNLPMLSLLEQIVIRARTMGGNKVELPVFLLSSKGQTIQVPVNFSHKDSAHLTLGNVSIHLKVSEDGKILSGKTSNGQTIKRLEKIPDAAFATHPPDYSAPPGAPYTAEDVRIQTKAGHVLAGTLTIPKNAVKPVPVVVTITGSSPQDRDHNTPFGGDYRIFRQLADELGRNGVAVLRMDDRGVGKSTGNFESATTPERADDIREGIAFVKQHKAIDKNRVALVGLSEGGMIAPMIAKTNSTLNGIVIMAGPASTGKDILKYQLLNSLDQSKEISQEKKEEAFQQAMKEYTKEAENNPWLRYFLTYDPLATAKQVKQVPVLILQGTTDKNVPPGDAKELEKAFKQAGNKDVTLKMFNNFNHVFLHDPNGNPKNYQNLKSFEVSPEVLQTIIGWVVDKTNAK